MAFSIFPVSSPSPPHPSPQELVLAMRISPGGSLLATVEVSGRLSLWDGPSFRLRRARNCEEQVSTWLINLTQLLLSRCSTATFAWKLPTSHKIKTKRDSTELNGMCSLWYMIARGTTFNTQHCSVM